MASKKVLLAGDVNGNFSTLSKRAAAVNKANGPFDLLLCAGKFLPDAANEDKAMKDLEDYIQGKKKTPVPTYFVAPANSSGDGFLRALSDPDSKADIHSLGKAGLEQLQGLNIAFLGQEFSQADLRVLEEEVGVAEGDIDFFLTVDWPAAITALTPPGSAPEKEVAGSKAIADLALKVRPRYHIAAGEGVFFARVPYLNKDLGAGSHVTRFIALAEVGNSAKQKSLHALGVQPAAQMETEILQQKPAGTTPCPYTVSVKRPMEDDGQVQDWRWQDGKRQKTAAASLGRSDIVKDDRKSIYVRNLPYKAEEEDLIGFFSACGEVTDVRRGTTDGKLNGWGFVQFASQEAAERACEMTEVMLMGRDLFIGPAGTRTEDKPSGEPVQGCWFCLSSQTADTSLVVSIGEEMYIAMDKGPINDHHVLILPIEHRSNSLALSGGAYIELERYLSALRSCFAAKGLLLLAFERYMTFKKKGGNHLQFNVLSIPAQSAKKARTVYEEVANRHGIKLKEVPGDKQGEAGRAALREAVGTGEYFSAILPDGTRLVHTISGVQRHPIPFGREAAAELAGVPQRADWKACQGDNSAEERMTSKFKELFKAYDIMS